MNKREARAIAYYLLAAWGKDVVNADGLSDWDDASALKIEREIEVITDRMFQRWYDAGAPKAHAGELGQ